MNGCVCCRVDVVKEFVTMVSRDMEKHHPVLKSLCLLTLQDYEAAFTPSSKDNNRSMDDDMIEET